MPFARCSELDRIMRCHGSKVLATKDSRSERVIEAADWGTMVHGWKATGLIEGPGTLPALFIRKLEKTKIDRETWWPGYVTHEATVAINPLKDYKIKRGECAEWKASLDDEWCTGTVDTFWMQFDELYIEDLKTGRFATLEDYRYQILGYALGLSRALQYSGRVHMLITHWPRYPVIGMPSRFGRVIESAELRQFEIDLANLKQNIIADKKHGLLATVAGDHCTFCPSQHVCTDFVEIPYSARYQPQK